MNVKLLMLPLFLTGALLMGCEEKLATKSPDAGADAKAAAVKADAVKAAADAKADATKTAADAKAAAAKTAANANAVADKAAANAKAEADKATADAKIAADEAAANAVRGQASKMITDLQTAVTDKKWADAGALVKQLDAVRDKLAADQKVSFDSLKKQYDANRGTL